MSSEIFKEFDGFSIETFLQISTTTEPTMDNTYGGAR